MYVRGFDDALAELHQAGAQQQQQVQILSTGQQQPNHHSLLETGSSISNNAQTAAPFSTAAAARPPTSLSPYPNTTMHQIPVKEEPRCGTSLSSSPPMSPIDMEDQERIKLERKRQRNRIAASKCRRRKLERIAKLEDKVKILKNDNSELGTVVVKLRQQVCGLKEQVMEHINCGCQIMLTNQF